MGSEAQESRPAPEPPGDPVPARAFDVAGPAGTGWRRVLAGLALRPEGRAHRRARLLDSVDARLGRAGIELSVESLEGSGVRCRLENGAPAAGEAELVLAHPPRFAWDFPPDQARRLAPVLEARELQPVGEHEETRRRWAVLDEEAKAVAWIDEERHRVRSTLPPGARPASCHRVVLQGLRGYGSAFDRLARRLEEAGPLVEATPGPWRVRSLLPVPGRRAGRWPELEPDCIAFGALGRIVRAQLEVLAANEAGLRAGVDAEYLHDVRVALRRLRSILGQLRGVLARPETEALVGGLKQLAAATGPARDLDTLLFELRLCEPELRAELAPAIAALEAERTRLQAELVAAYDAPAARALRRRLRTAFTPRAARTRGGPRARSPFARVLAKRLRRRLDAVLEGAASAGPTTPAAALHELRIACKKLRYLLECCRGLVPSEVLSGCFRTLKGLQSALGTLQDTEVQGQSLRAFATRATALPAPALLALGRFLERGEARAREARAHFASLAGLLLAPESRARFDGVLAALRAAAR